MSTNVAVTAAPAVNPKTIVSFVNAVRAVFGTMVGVPVTIGKPVLKQQPAPSYDVSGIIGFSGEITGSAVISLPRDTAIKLVAAFAGTMMDAESADFADAIGELANMVAGNAKKDLGGRASISCPNVVIGASHVVARLSDVPCIVIPCETPVGSFAVEICIKQSDPQGANGGLV